MTDRLWVDEDWFTVQDGERVYCGNSGAYETFATTTGELYRAYLKDGNRCISSIVHELEDGTVERVGWVFERKVKDGRDTYKQETWVTVLSADMQPVEITVMRHVPVAI